jgi:hypothetical protein
MGESIVLTSDIKSGWLTFDLSTYGIAIQETAFYLVFEWILDDEDRFAIFNKLADYASLNPEKLIRDTVIIEGEKVSTTQFSSFAPIPIIAFGDTRTKPDLLNFKCYSRSNSFGKWERSSGILSAKLLVSNQPSSGHILPNSKEVSAIDTSNEAETLGSKITNWVEDFADYYNIPGMQLSICSQGNTIFSDGFGYSDIENKVSVTENTRFRIASVTKPMTAAAIVDLASKGLIDLDADVRNYVPSFPAKKHPFTTRQLAGHLAGIRDYYELSTDELFNNPHFETATEALDVFKNDSVMSEPGNEFIYSSFGYTLLGAVIEGATGQSYLDYMLRGIWSPLAMSSTYGDIADSIMVNKSKFYNHNEEEGLPYDLSYSHPSGGLISTTDDLVKFGNELLFRNFFE